MVIKLLSTQIPAYWEYLKFAKMRADELESDKLQPYLVGLLHDLLNDKAQCFIRLDDNREIIGILITSLIIDKITDIKQLCLQCVFSRKNVDTKEWEEDFKLIKDFATQEKCKYIYFDSKVAKLWQIAESVGFQEHHRNYRFDMEDI